MGRGLDPLRGSRVWILNILLTVILRHIWGQVNCPGVIQIMYHRSKSHIWEIAYNSGNINSFPLLSNHVGEQQSPPCFRKHFTFFSKKLSNLIWDNYVIASIQNTFIWCTAICFKALQINTLLPRRGSSPLLTPYY